MPPKKKLSLRTAGIWTFFVVMFTFVANTLKIATPLLKIITDPHSKFSVWASLIICVIVGVISFFYIIHILTYEIKRIKLLYSLLFLVSTIVLMYWSFKYAYRFGFDVLEDKLTHYELKIALPEDHNVAIEDDAYKYLDDNPRIHAIVWPKTDQPTYQVTFSERLFSDYSGTSSTKTTSMEYPILFDIEDYSVKERAHYLYAWYLYLQAPLILKGHNPKEEERYTRDLSIAKEHIKEVARHHSGFNPNLSFLEGMINHLIYRWEGANNTSVGRGLLAHFQKITAAVSSSLSFEDAIYVSAAHNSVVELELGNEKLGKLKQETLNNALKTLRDGHSLLPEGVNIPPLLINLSRVHTGLAIYNESDYHFAKAIDYADRVITYSPTYIHGYIQKLKILEDKGDRFEVSKLCNYIIRDGILKTSMDLSDNTEKELDELCSDNNFP